MTILYADVTSGMPDQLDLILGGAPIQCAVTSPPYWGLRTYGDSPDELGAEDLHRYLDRLVTTFDYVRGRLAGDGLLWVNIADTAAGSGGAGGDYAEGGRAPAQRRRYKQARPTVRTTTLDLLGEPTERRLDPGQWCNIPGRLVAAMQDDRWRFRSWITWAKMTKDGGHRVRPEDLNHANRPGVSSEAILVFAPGPGRSKFYPDRLRERGDVWTFPPVSGRYRGPAPFPLELPTRCVVSSTDPGDWVLDPFVGSGTTVEAAELIGRRGVGIDLYPPVPEED